MNPALCFACLRRLLELALAALGWALAASAGAATVLTGTVTDRITGAALVGARVEVFRGAESLGHTVIDDPQGIFKIAVEVDSTAQVNLKLQVSRSGYANGDEDVVVVAGQPRPAAPVVALRPAAVADCLPRLRAPSVVVGHFRPPPDAQAGAGISGMVFDAVRTQLLLIAEIPSLAADRRPAVVACEGIDERDRLKDVARELKADALLSGGVARPPGSGRYTVSMFVGDPHGIFSTTTPFTSREVDLLDPAASRLDATALAKIFQALLTGYQKAGRFEDCVMLAGQVQKALRPSTREIAELSAQCAQRLPAQGLRGGPR